MNLARLLLFIISVFVFSQAALAADDTPTDPIDSNGAANVDSALNEDSEPQDPASSDNTQNDEPLTQPTDELASEAGDEKETEAGANNATAPAAPEIPRITPNLGSKRINDVLTHLGLFQQDQQVIKFGDDDSTLSGLYLPENTGTPQGGVLILHDIEQNALWPQTVGPLREYLPDYGWNTLSLFFGNYLQRPLPGTVQESASEDVPAPESIDDAIDPITPIDLSGFDDATASQDENADPIDQNFVDAPQDSLGELADQIGELPDMAEAENEVANAQEKLSPNDEFLQNMQLRVDDGLRQLNTLGQFNLVIVAYGLSANWAAASLSERFKDRPGVRGYALVLIDARPNQYPVVDLNEKLALLNIPLLDIVTGNSPNEKRVATERRNAITRKQNRQYIQIQLPKVRTSLTGKKTLVTRRIRGWLKSNAAGEEVDVTSR